MCLLSFTLKSLAIPSRSKQQYIYKFNKHVLLLSVKFITMSKSGKQHLMINKYIYYKKSTLQRGMKWCCTNCLCRAYVKTSHELEIQEIRGEHLHQPAKYHQLADGTYIKVGI
ncbi:hypothetical protein JYU34_004334 [Plutella xylostella]|uniref:FLYWCH-type domain-containing protein n=1 Tax=Plutella xylostella TaxID=51655 RepID=A0ABQ7QXP9_PLUXY|nr:hypothetical protein JYU34_004334 [Plutella xylostella]